MLNTSTMKRTFCYDTIEIFGCENKPLQYYSNNNDESFPNNNNYAHMRWHKMIFN